MATRGELLAWMIETSKPLTTRYFAGFDDANRRIADALRVIEVIENRPAATLAREIQQAFQAELVPEAVGYANADAGDTLRQDLARLTAEPVTAPVTIDPATRQAIVLGAGDRVSNGCQTTGAVLLCRLVDASIAVWPLR